MVLNIILLLLLSAAGIIIILLIRRQAGDRKQLLQLVEEFAPERTGNSENLTILKKSLLRFSDIFSTLRINGKKSERSTARLSRNIQKALIYTADIRTNAEANRKTSGQLFQFVTEGSAAVEEIHASIRNLKEQMTVQNREIQQTTESIEGIDAALRRISEIASSRQEDTSALVEYTDLGNEKITKTDTVIDEVLNKVGDVLSLITVINQVAAQTNLLSMNAAIEAAHAGDAGRGFAVVAEEIRNLATSTAGNAKSISDTLKNLVAEIESASRLSKESGETFSSIEEGVKNVSAAFLEIKDYTAEVSGNTQELVTSSETLQSISAETTSSMEEMEIGTGEINSILNNSRLISEDLDGSMSALSDDTKSINLSMTKISHSFLNVNQALGAMVSEVAAFDQEKQEEGDLQKRIDFSTLILSHINWVATARAVLDGSLEEKDAKLISPKDCVLGKWLEKEDTRKFLGGEKYHALHSSHEALHTRVRQITDLKTKGKDDEAEIEYRTLVEESRKVVQILTTLGYSDFVEWTPALSVHIQTFDGHHQQLIKLINRLYQSMETGEGDEALLKILQELIDYTDYHFAAEEKAFEAFGYPEAVEHIEMHQALLKKARSLYAELTAGRSVLSNEVLDFLQDWVMNHILKADTRYTAYLKEKDVDSLVAAYRR